MKTARFLGGLLAACMFFPAFSHAQRGPSGPTPVITAPVEKIDFSDQVEALATVRAYESVVITADTSEKISEIHFEDGQVVTKGDLLVTLDQAEEQAALTAARAQLAEARSSYNRAKGLQTSSALSKATLQEREAILKQMEAALTEIQARIDNRTITAPFDGVLGLREASVGALVQPGEKITTIDALDRVKVDFDVPSVFLSSLRPGLPVTGKVAAFGEREFNGEIATVNTQVDPVTRTVRVRAIMPNDDHVLKPGLLMTVVLKTNPRQTLVIPEEAIIKRGDKTFAFTINEVDGKSIAAQTEIEVGGRQPGLIEVRGGLSAGEQVISHGLVKIGNGSEITVRAVETEDQTLDVLLQQQPAAGAENPSAAGGQ